VPGKEMLDQCMYPAITPPAQFVIFVDRQISCPPRRLRLEQGRGDLASQSIEFFAAR
jgi:hypothetical protein